jgi:O-acetyl-ADP-ribose deacetylase (regulator of RNase III)
MAILIETGDLFSSQAQTIVNTINCKGIMGAGIALRCKKLFPEVYADYVVRCKSKSVKTGEPYLFCRDQTPWILNFPTKNHWRNHSKLHYISDGLMYLANHYNQWGITSLAFPALGCGNGGLLWPDVGPIMYASLQQFHIPVTIYLPDEIPSEQKTEKYLTQSTHTNDNICPTQLELFATESTN